MLRDVHRWSAVKEPSAQLAPGHRYVNQMNETVRDRCIKILTGVKSEKVSSRQAFTLSKEIQEILYPHPQLCRLFRPIDLNDGKYKLDALSFFRRQHDYVQVPQSTWKRSFCSTYET